MREPTQGPAGEPATARSRVPADLFFVACGVVSALHVGKLPTALPVLRDELGFGLVQAGFLLSLVQGAAMLGALALGLAVGHIGLRRALLAGLVVLALGSGAGALAGSVAALAWSRAAEGLGFLLVSVAAPALIRQVVPPQRLALSMGLWGTYMPTGTALALLLGPLVAGCAGWRWWWAALAGLAALAALALVRRMGLRDPSAMPGVAGAADAAPAEDPGPHSSRAGALRGSLGTSGPWLVGAIFACYAAQWLTVIGFLPTVYDEAGIGGLQAGAMTAAVALANVTGNLAAGRLLHRGWAPQRLLLLGFGAMALGAFLAFGLSGHWPEAARFAAVLGFSAFGGLVPATLFTAAVRVAPSGAAVPAVLGLTIQCSAVGQFVGPPLAAAWTAAHGGWSAIWIATGMAALAGALLALALGRRLQRPGLSVDS